MQVYLNGAFTAKESAAISPVDRGFLFGDGIYEVTRVVEGESFREREHLNRLDAGLKGLKIRLDEKIRNQIPEIGKELIKRNDLEKGEATIYLQVTRGAAWPRTHTFPEPEVVPTIYMSVSPFKPHTDLHKTGVDTITVSDVRWSRCNLKTVNLLPNTLARQQAKEAGVNSAVMIRDGVVTESPNANIFGVKGGELYTYPESNFILGGITRAVVLEIAERLGITVNHNPIRSEELFELDELFFSGTTTDIQPIIKVDGKKIGDGNTGRVVEAIQDEYKKLLYG